MTEPDPNRPNFIDFYDELPLWSAPFGLRILERAPLRRGATMVDIGCGTGFLSIELALRCGRDARIYAVDPWPAAIDRLERKLAYHGIENVELVRQGGEAMGLPDGCADLIVSNLGVNNFSDPAAVLAECRRVMKPDGRLFVTTNLQGHMAEAYSALHDVLDETGLQDRHEALSRQESHRGTVASVSALLSACGFTEIAHEESNFAMRFADGTAMLGHWLMRLAFIPGWIAATGNDPRVLPALEAALNAQAAKAGILSLTIPCALFQANRP